MLGVFFAIAIIVVITALLIIYLPMPPVLKTLLIVVAVLFCALLALGAIGVLPWRDYPSPQIR